ncbi:Phospholipid N-methyltransferase [Seinonella peptonophila]|uniref:Phospholipid N-methyltransferase n=1 Tax=Seinonella peptonophila TaxID=112248 RepID=A0A1M4X6H7_9BACL|nr:rRNA adenine N-6-methyltransferase family protein [Seinonella peptonophila]SHE89100.1 Phospholipid N-methyltransferase [Seinonella peptonophila]
MSWRQRVQFLSRFLQNPKKIGSVTPSSRFLVEALLDPVDWAKVKTIVELGAGTGVLTRKIARRIRDDSHVYIFEQDSKLAQALKARYPQMIHCSDAKQLSFELEMNGVHQVDCIISSLPFANFSMKERVILLKGIQQVLAQKGVFIAYQYSLQMRGLFEEYFPHVDTRFIPFNLPPSFVYICRKDPCIHLKLDRKKNTLLTI